MLCIKHNEIPQPPNFLYLIFGIGKDGIFILCSEKHTHKKSDSYVLFNEKNKDSPQRNCPVGTTQAKLLKLHQFNLGRKSLVYFSLYKLAQIFLSFTKNSQV